MNKIELKFKLRAAIDRGTYFLLIKDDAIDFVKECREENIEILGIDAFYKIDKETVKSSIENSIDFSSSSYTLKTDSIYNDAIKFLGEKEEILFFEIVCE